MADQTEVLDATGVVTPVSSEPSEVTMASYSADDLAKAREQEKAKLYPQMEKMKEELANLKKKAEEEAALRADKEAKRAAKEAERVAKQKSQEESELSFKELLAKKEQEFSAQLESERLEREKAFAILDKERQFNELVSYRSTRLNQERDNIVPELIDLISGNTQEEI